MLFFFHFFVSDEDNQVVPSFRGINCTRHLLRATIAIFHKFGKPGSEGYLKAEPDQLDATYLFSILRSVCQVHKLWRRLNFFQTYQSFSFNHIGISWANEIQEPTLFDDIKNRPDDPSRRYIWVARVDEDGFREYRASSLIKETITLLESFPDWEISCEFDWQVGKIIHFQFSATSSSVCEWMKKISLKTNGQMFFIPLHNSRDGFSQSSSLLKTFWIFLKEKTSIERLGNWKMIGKWWKI